MKYLQVPIGETEEQARHTLKEKKFGERVEQELKRESESDVGEGERENEFWMVRQEERWEGSKEGDARYVLVVIWGAVPMRSFYIDN